MCVLWPDLIQLGEIEPNILFYWEQEKYNWQALGKIYLPGVSSGHNMVSSQYFCNSKASANIDAKTLNLLFRSKS